jgi:hypothetical protein
MRTLKGKNYSSKIRRCVVKKSILLCASFLVLLTVGFLIGSMSANAAGNKIAGLQYYPGAKEDPANPAINVPHMQNVHLLTGDSFEKVLTWYTQKIGKFTDASSSKGKQSLWRNEPKEGGFMTVTISTIEVPPGQVRITMTKANLKIK